MVKANGKPDTSDVKLAIDRRKLLTLTGAGAGGFLAGCVGQEDDPDDADDENGVDDDPAPDDEDDPLVRNEFVTTHLGAQEDVQFNPHNTTLPPEWDITNAVFTQTVVDSRTHGTHYPVGLRDWEIEPDEVTVHVLDGLTWHNGDPVTAADFVRRVRIGYYAPWSRGYSQMPENVIEDPEDVYAVDETTAVVELDQVYNPIIARDEVVVGAFSHHEEHYGEYLEMFEDATTDEEIGSIVEDLASFNLRDPEPYACGPFEFTGVDSQGVYMETYDDYPWAEIQENLEENYEELDLSAYPDELNYDGQFHQFFGERPALHQAGIQGDIDGGDGFEIDSEADLEQYPAYADFNPIISGWTDAFVFNWVDGEHADMWRDERVRKAFAHILDFEAISRQYHGEFGHIDRMFSGTSPPMRDPWLTEEFLESLPTYGRDEERAAALLDDAGLTQEDGQWYKPDGEPFEATWAAPSTVQWQIDGMEYAASNLTQFGIESTVEVVEGTTFFGQTLPNLDYELSRGFIGFENVVSGWNLTWIRYDGEDQEDEPFSYYLQEPYGEPGLEVPPVGEPDSDETIEVDPVALQEELEQTVDDDRITEISETLSWTFNQTVPKLPGSAGVYGWYMTERWNYPNDYGEDPLAGLMPFTYSLPQIGAISAKRESEFEF